MGPDAEATLGKENVDAMLDCIMKKVEAGYENMAQADADHAGMEKLGTNCAIEVMSGQNP